jgi:hypothetical protein
MAAANPEEAVNIANEYIHSTKNGSLILSTADGSVSVRQVSIICRQKSSFCSTKSSTRMSKFKVRHEVFSKFISCPYPSL